MGTGVPPETVGRGGTRLLRMDSQPKAAHAGAALSARNRRLSKLNAASWSRNAALGSIIFQEWHTAFTNPHECTASGVKWPLSSCLVFFRRWFLTRLLLSRIFLRRDRSAGRGHGYRIAGWKGFFQGFIELTIQVLFRLLFFPRFQALLGHSGVIHSALRSIVDECSLRFRSFSESRDVSHGICLV